MAANAPPQTPQDKMACELARLMDDLHVTGVVIVSCNQWFFNDILQSGPCGVMEFTMQHTLASKQTLVMVRPEGNAHPAVPFGIFTLKRNIADRTRLDLWFVPWQCQPEVPNHGRLDRSLVSSAIVTITPNNSSEKTWSMWDLPKAKAFAFPPSLRTCLWHDAFPSVEEPYEVDLNDRMYYHERNQPYQAFSVKGVNHRDVVHVSLSIYSHPRRHEGSH